MEQLKRTKLQNSSSNKLARCVLSRCRIRHVLRATVAVCLFGLYLNIQLSLHDTPATFLSRSLTARFLEGRRLMMVDGIDANNATLEHEAKGAFSACLILKDDNHWLIEWLAYHYHVLPLRHLILVNDPTSITSPTNILDRWSSKMIIEQWNDTDFLPEWVHRKARNLSLSDLWLHLNRQNFFYGKCLQSLKRQNRTLVALIDSDEFIRLNPYRYQVTESLRRAPGHILKFLNKLRREGANRTCMLLPRIQVSTLEKPAAGGFLRKYSAIDVPKPFNASNFLTLRFLWHNEMEMEAGKNVVDLRNVDLKALHKRTESVHRALSSCPNNTADLLFEKESHLNIQHYLGTWEQFTFREDPRDSLYDRWSNWHTRGTNPEPKKRDTAIVPWLSGFVQSHGIEQASALLKNVGKLEPRATPDSRNRDYLGPPPPPGDFSSCLLLKDDNHWLAEWLAYHYHVLPLRDLIVLNDPTSRTSPDKILQRWRGRINIEMWKDSAIIPPHIFKKVKTANITQSGLHRQRQQFFYGHCLRSFKKRNASWVLLADTDEFVVPNSYANASHRIVPSLKKPGAVRKILLQGIRSRKTKDPDFVAQCLLLPRLQMTSQLPNQPGVIDRDIPFGFSGRDFLTATWLFHNGHEIYTGHNLDGKNIVNLDDIKLDKIPSKVQNVHFVLPDFCPVSDGKRLSHQDTWLWIYHYLGSLEQFLFRNDPRDDIPGRPKRNETLWKQAGRRGEDGVLRKDTVAIRAWLRGFVESVGWLEAKRLLRGVGKTDRPSFFTAWSIGK